MIIAVLGRTDKFLVRLCTRVYRSQVERAAFFFATAGAMPRSANKVHSVHNELPDNGNCMIVVQNSTRNHGNQISLLKKETGQYNITKEEAPQLTFYVVLSL